MAEVQHQQPPNPRGRPPSYPAVVTTTGSSAAAAVTTESTTGASGEMLSPSMNSAAAAAPPSSLEAAIKLYERDGNAAASLDACRRIWGEQKSSDGDSKKGAGPGKNDTAAENNSIVEEALENDTVPLSRQHNQVVLEHLSSLRSSRRLVRPRPSSFDKNEAMDGVEKGDDKGRKDSKDLSIILSTMLSDSKLSAEGKEDSGSHLQGGTAGKKNMSAKAKPNAEAAPSPVNKGDQEGNYNHLVGPYNVCLSQYAAGKYQEALNGILVPFLAAMKSIEVDAEGVKVKMGGDASSEAADITSGAAVDKKKESAYIGFLFMTTRIAFLVLDCHLALFRGNGLGLSPIIAKEVIADGENEASVKPEEVLAWIENNALSLTSKGEDAFDHSLLDQYESFTHDELKFRLHIYRSQMLFLGENPCDGSSNPRNELETRTRVSRKELKNAMDIYQNKLCVVEDEGRVHGKKGKHSKNHGGSKSGSGGALTSTRKSHQDVSETTSVTSMAGGSLVTSVSDAIWSEGKGGLGVARATFEGMPNKNAAQQQQQQQQQQTSHPPGTSAAMKEKKDSPGLQMRHESVLYMKANLEYLRGNTSKSLKLCAEARSAGKKSRAGEEIESKEDGKSHENNSDWNVNEVGMMLSPNGETQMEKNYDEAIYYNNLALLHQSAGKVHLALHYYTYALSYIEKVFDGKSSAASPFSQNFWSNGMARPDITADILNNTSLCAFQAQEFNVAYESMARCVKLSSTVFGKRARCWLRMAQSCIGIYVKLQQASEPREGSSAMLLDSNVLGSKEDLANIAISPLPRALFCLYLALHLSAGNMELNFEAPTANDDSIPSLNEGGADVDCDCFKMALVSIAYVKLQLGDTQGYLQTTKHVIGEFGSAGNIRELTLGKQH